MFEGLQDVGEARLWVRDTGGGGEPLVLCHPRSQSSEVWVHQCDAFAAAGFRVVAYSRRGVFRSEPGNPVDPGSQVGDLANLLEARGIEAAHLLGAAAGGITAAGFAVAHPERTLSLVLAGSIVAPDEPDWREVYDRLAIRDLEYVVPVELLELGPAYRARNPEGTAAFARLSKTTTAQSEPVAQPLGAHVTWSAFARMPVPTLLVTGEADLYAPPPVHELVAQHIPNNRVETLRAVGHAPYWETPEAFNRIVLDFLGSNARLRRPSA